MFETTTNAHMLFLSKTVSDPASLTIVMDKFPVCTDLTLGQMFDAGTDIGMTAQPLVVAVNRIRNQVAKNSRRGAGNIVFVQTQAEKDELLKSHIGLDETNIYVDSALQDGEVRTTYWRLIYGSMDAPDFYVVDGGVQHTPAGWVTSPNWERYFAKGRYK